MHDQHLTATSRRTTLSDTPLGIEAAEYLRHKTKRLTPASQRSYSATLRWLALDYPAVQVEELEPPNGTCSPRDWPLRDPFTAGQPALIHFQRRRSHWP